MAGFFLPRASSFEIMMSSGNAVDFHLEGVGIIWTTRMYQCEAFCYAALEGRCLSFCRRAYGHRGVHVCDFEPHRVHYTLRNRAATIE